MARTPVLPKETPVGVLTAQSAVSGREQRTRSFDPLRPFKIGTVNGQKAGASGLRLQAQPRQKLPRITTRAAC
jgi:hypothetical protein